MPLPPNINFQMMAENFIDLCSERYYSSAKVLETANRMVSDSSIGSNNYLKTALKIIILSRFRDMIRDVALNQVFKTVQRRDEFYMAVIEALEDLEDELEELEQALQSE